MQAAEQLDGGADGGAAAPQRHVLVVGLLGGDPPRHPGVGGHAVLRVHARPVVLDLVIVPGHDPRRGRVELLQVGVGLVGRVAQAVVLQRGAQTVGVLADRGGARPALVDVVAEREDEIGAVLGRTTVGGEPAALPVGAGQVHHAQVPAAARSGGGQRAAGAGDVTAGAEAVEELGVRGEVLELDVQAVALLGQGGLGAAAHDVAEALVARELPAHLDGHRGHAAAAVEHVRVDGQTGPQHHGARGRIARGDAEGEGVLAAPGAVVGEGRRRAEHPGGGERGQRGGGEVSPGHPAPTGEVRAAVGGDEAGGLDGLGGAEIGGEIHGSSLSGRGRATPMLARMERIRESGGGGDKNVHPVLTEACAGVHRPVMVAPAGTSGGPARRPGAAPAPTPRCLGAAPGTRSPRGGPQAQS